MNIPRTVSRSFYSAFTFFVLAAQLWAVATCLEARGRGGILSPLMLHPYALCVLVGVMAFFRFGVACPPAGRFGLPVAAVVSTCAGMAFFACGFHPGAGATAGMIVFTSWMLYGLQYRVWFGARESVWAAIPLAGPLAGIWFAGVAKSLSENGAWDRAARRLPVAMLATGATFLTTTVLHDYGWFLFVLLPVVIGFAASYSDYDDNDSSPWTAGFASALAALSWVYFLLLVTLLEGVVCLLMAAVIAYPLALLGGCLGVLAGKWTKPAGGGRMRTVSLLFVVPLAANFSIPAPKAEHREVTTECVIAAPPDQVWAAIHNLEIGDATDDWIFRSGVAMPVATRTPEGKVGGVRECVLSTGVMREVISVWEPEHTLEFLVLETPPCMKETGLHGDIETPHLTGKFRCLKGRFDLEALPGGRTRVTGASLVALDVHPVAYWGLWSDEIVHRVHRRVFDAIAKKAEKISCPPEAK